MDHRPASAVCNDAPTRPALLVRLIAALLLLAIGLHATPSSNVSVQPERGSAFSAATAEVALAPREEASAEQRIAAPFPLPLKPQPASLAAGRTEQLEDRRPPLVLARGPPPRELHGPQLAPRAPPIS